MCGFRVIAATLALATVTSFATTVRAQTTWYVDDDNCPGPGSGSPADPFCAIQTGIDSAANGDTCLVAPGTYFETINFNGKAITLRSSDGSNVSTIDGTALNNSVVKCVNSEGSDTVLQGFTITGGTGSPHPGQPNLLVGGGMHNNGSSPTVNNCAFNGNTPGSVGGGMFNINNSNPTVTNCTFTGNLASNGGAMFTDSGSPHVEGCVFSQNTVGNDGGAVVNTTNSSATFTNCIFRSNHAGADGGAMRNVSNSNTTTINCLFVGNTAARHGGAIVNEGSDPIVVSSTFYRNTAANSGGGIIVGFQCCSTTTITDSIFWENTDAGGLHMDESAQIHVHNGTAIVAYCDVQGGWTGATGTGNINADPQFVDAFGPDGIVGTEDDDLRLAPASPCIDVGDNTGLPSDTLDLDGDGDTTEPLPLDLDRNPRIVDGDADGTPTVDMGAYELGPSNQSPLCDSGGPYPAECTGGSTTVALDGAGSMDADGDLLAYLWTTDCPGGVFDDAASPTPVLTVGSGEACGLDCGVTLMVDDGNGGVESCSTTVSIADTTPPVVTCSVSPVSGDGDDDEEERLMISYSATDACGVVMTGSAVVDTPCCPVPVSDGQIIKFECADHPECELELDFEEGLFEIEADTATLSVTATDTCGNTATCTIDLCVWSGP